MFAPIFLSAFVVEGELDPVIGNSVMIIGYLGTRFIIALPSAVCKIIQLRGWF
jgi:hypothetical protein